MGESWVAKDEHTRQKFLEFAKEYMEEHRLVEWTWKGETSTGRVFTFLGPANNRYWYERNKNELST